MSEYIDSKSENNDFQIMLKEEESKSQLLEMFEKGDLSDNDFINNMIIINNNGDDPSDELPF